jgi:tRNA A-37 threonylcarbamoyl transferase component Bud32
MAEAPPTNPSFTLEHVPVPAPGSEAATLAPAAAVPAAGAAAPPEQVPGYDLLGVLGRGGMGVVYKARHQRLNRLVALKMILASGHAGEAELARFRTEAEAVARLRHPGVVQIYDVGEHNGLPYLALEYCEGGSLAGRLAGTPLPPAQAAALVEQLARAVDAAHQQKVIHRDLKPANVLLAGGPDTPVGQLIPKVTDFGLAKKLDEASGLTQSNAILGTPSYMAPEQAGGKGKQVGPAADIYALGAILYECLTGRPPFRAATTMDTVLQVLNDEPVPPSQLQPKTPRDLETICLRCLHKEPRRRYPTAAALAEDLRRYQAGEPIVARPVGSVERVVKWARRRPAAAALLVSLVLGMATSTYFAVQASRQAHDAEISAGLAAAKEKEAREKEAEARARETEAREEKQRATEAHQRTEATLARSLLRPLGHSPGVPNDIELEALWELAESPSPHVHQLFLDYALERPATTRQLRNRHELAVHAAVGLDPVKRRRLEDLLLQRLKDETADPEWRANYAWVALEMIRPGRELTQVVARRLSDALDTEKVDAYMRELVRALNAVATRMEPAEATKLRRSAETRLLCVEVRLRVVEAIIKEPNVSTNLWEVSAMLVRLQPAEAARKLPEAVAKTANSSARVALTRALWVLASRLEPAEATRLYTEGGRLLAVALARETNPSERTALAEALETLATLLEPGEATQLFAEAARLLATTLIKEKDRSAQAALARSLDRIAVRLEPADAATLAQQLSDALPKEFSPSLLALARALEAVAARMEPAAAARLLADGLARATNSSVLALWARSLDRVTDRLEPVEAMRISTETTRLLADALAKEPNAGSRHALAEPLRTWTARLEAAEARRISTKAARLLADDLAKEKNAFARAALARTLVTVAAQLEPAEGTRLSAEAARFLANDLAKEKNASAKATLVQALAAVAPQLEPAEGTRLATEAARLLADDLAKESSPNVRSQVAQAFVAVTDRLEPAEATRLFAEAARRLADALGNEQNSYEQEMSARDLGSVAMRMEPAEGGRLLAEALSRHALAKASNPRAGAELARALVAVSARLGPTEAMAVVRQVADELAKNTNSFARSQLAGCLAAAVVRVDPGEASTRSPLTARAVAGWLTPSPQLGNLTVLLQAAEPLPCRFTTQQLVDLLKMPTCVGEARAVILEQLSYRYRRSFADVWDFVEWAEKYEPGLDFTTPPRRVVFAAGKQR